MLQQTQVLRVIPKYRAFLKTFPKIQALNRAPLAMVLKVWQGMGYNRRALALKRLAKIVVERFGGKIPANAEALASLPGVGPGTAGAIMAFAFNQRVAFIETNIRRVFLHFFFRKSTRVRDRDILKKIAATRPRQNIRAWYYALMDYGAAAMKSIPNPNRKSRHYARQSRFEGSRRELRGRVIRELAARGSINRRTLAFRLKELRATEHPRHGDFNDILSDLKREGLIEIRRDLIDLPG